MPTIQYPKNPNTDTAFVVQDDGTKNRALMTAPQDTSTLELPSNPNSTKGYVTVNGKKQRVILTADIGGGGGDSHNKGYYATQAALEEAYPTGEAGDYAIVGSTDTVWIWDDDTSAWVDSDTKGQVVSVNSKTGTVVLTAEDVGALPQYSTMPVASSSNSGLAVQYTGATNASYTTNYIYKNVATTTPSSATASQTAGSSLTDVAVVVATFETQITTSGSYVFTSDGVDWSYDGNVVDLTDYGITYTGTPVADDAITVVYTAESTSYAWTRVDVQPAPEALPSQTGQSGKFLTTDGTDASWSDKPLVNNATGTGGFSINGTSTAQEGFTIKGTANFQGAMAVGIGSNCYAAYSMAIGRASQTRAQKSTAIGDGAKTYSKGAISIGSNASSGIYLQENTDTHTIAIGANAGAKAIGAIQLGTTATDTATTNSDANTFKVANANGNFEIMSADGTVPTARLTKVNTTATLAVADWSSSTQTVTVSGVKADSVVFVSPDPTSASDYASAGILCTAQAADSLTFTCTTTPTNAITVNIVCL